MSSLLSERPAQIFDLPLPPDVPVLHPEQVILRFEHGKTIDLGALCYLERETPSRSRARRFDTGRLVRLESLCPKRVAQVRSLMAQISDEIRHVGLRSETLRDRYSRFIAFMAWADNGGYQDVLAEVDKMQSALTAYIAHLRERVRRMEISLNSAARQQVCVFAVLEAYHNMEDLGRGLNILYVDPKTKESTRPPSETAQSRVLSLCESIFDGICDLVLTPSTFPYGIRMPRYLGLANNTIWAFPSVSWFMSPSMLENRHAMWCPGWAYNYAEGRLSTLDEIRAVNSLPGLKDFARDSDITRRSMLRAARLQLDAANADPQHCQRRQLAFQAMNTFLILFLAETAMNWAQLTELSWSDEHVVEASRQGFRTVKWRAGGKEVSFEIPINFMPKFKCYLALRKYLLNGRACETLFFKQGVKGQDAEPTPIRANLNPVYLMLRRIDPDLPKVLPREWRAAKSDWLVRNTDPSTAALVLQNTEKTVLKSYAEGSEVVHLAEMSKFLDEVASRVLPPDEPVQGSVPGAVGLCASFGSPVPIADVSIRPDCKRPEGCLFCDKFKVHADEKDTRKLLSCRYCLRQTTYLMGSEEQINALLGPIFERIEAILNEIRGRDKEMVERVTREVEQDGELDHYWAHKYDMLVSLGIVG